MNQMALIQYISKQLHTNVRKYSQKKELLLEFCEKYDFIDPVFSLSPELLENMLSFDKENSPTLFCVNQDLIYAVVSCGAVSFLIGPVRLEGLIDMKHEFPNVPVSEYNPDFIPALDFSFYLREILLVYNLFHKKIKKEQEVILHNCVDKSLHNQIEKNFSEMVFETQEHQTRHNPYDQEIRELSSIERGDIRGLEQSIAENYNAKLGTLAKDKTRNLKNLCIVVIALASRAAIRGGLHPEISFSLSDNYIQKIEETMDTPSLLHLLRGAEYHYTSMVHDLHQMKKNQNPEQNNPNINLCKDYIFSHLHDKITVQDLAEHLHLNPNYLSELFKKSEGISLYAYILQEKIDRTKNLLIYSRYSYIDIAAYLGFSSQSHLGKQFKKMTGYTLRKYRLLFGVKEFQ